MVKVKKGLGINVLIKLFLIYVYVWVCFYIIFVLFSNEWMNECLMTPQHKKQIGYWVSDKRKMQWNGYKIKKVLKTV